MGLMTPKPGDTLKDSTCSACVTPLRRVLVNIDMAQFGRHFGAIYLKHRLLSAGIPVTEVTDTHIAVSRGTVRWEMFHKERMFCVEWTEEDHEQTDHTRHV